MAKLIDITGKAISGEWGNDDDAGTGIPVLRTTNFTNDGVVNYNNVVTRDIQKKDLSQKYLQPGDIIIEKSGGSDKQPVGRVVYYDGEPNRYLFNNFTGVLRVRNQDVWYPRYVFYALYGNYAKGGTRRYENKTTGLHNLKTDQYVQDFVIQEQTPEYQQLVVSKLDKVSELIALRKEQLAKLDQLVKSRFIEMFGDVSDFVNITDIAHTYIGLVTTMTKHYCNNGTPLLFNSSIKSDKIIWDGTYLDMEFAEANKSRMHKTNDIVTVHTGDIGTSAVVGEEFNNSLGFATIVTRINDISRYYPRFVSSFLNYGSGKEQLKKYSRDVRNNLNLKDFNRLMVPNVSALEQKRYVDFLEQTDKSKLAIQQSLDKLELLKKFLMQEYFA